MKVPKLSYSDLYWSQRSLWPELGQLTHNDSEWQTVCCGDLVEVKGHSDPIRSGDLWPRHWFRLPNFGHFDLWPRVYGQNGTWAHRNVGTTVCGHNGTCAHATDPLLPFPPIRQDTSSNCEWNKILSFTSDLWGPPGFRLGTNSLHSVYSASFWYNQSPLCFSSYVCGWHWTNFSAWCSGSWRCLNKPSLVTRWSVV